MRIEHKDFIGVYRGVYPEGYCAHLIKEFDRLEVSGAGNNRVDSENARKDRKNDYQIGLNFPGQSVEGFNNTSAERLFFEGLQKCYRDYSEQFPTLRDGKIHATAMKVQKTYPGGGYHVWHSEQGNGVHAERVLVYSLYLNSFSPEEGGETEFLFQKTRIPPVENTMIIWPAAFTHTHRGNTVLGDKSKYIVTGWFYYE